MNDTCLMVLLLSLLGSCTCVSVWLFSHAAGGLNLRRLNLLSYSLYLSFLVNCVIGIFLLTLDIGVRDYYLLAYIPRESSTVFVVASVSWAIVGVPIGSLIAARWLKISPRRALTSFYSRAVVAGKASEDRSMWMMTALIVASIVASWTAVTRLGTIPLIAAFSMSPSEIAVLRGSSKFEYAGNAIMKNVFAKTVPVFVSYASIVWMSESRRWWWRVLFGASLVLSLIGVTLAFEKAPLVQYTVGIAFLQLASQRGDGTRLKEALIYIVASLVIAFSASALLGGVFDANALLEGVGYRLLLSQIVPLYFYPEVFPRAHPYIMGASYPTFWARLLGADSIRASRIVMAYRNPGGVASNVAGHMNTLFVGEAYANWSYWGIAFSPIIVGIVMGLLYYVLITRRKTPTWLAAYALLCVDVPLTGGFLDFLYNPGWAFVLLTAAAFNFATHDHHT